MGEMLSDRSRYIAALASPASIDTLHFSAHGLIGEIPSSISRLCYLTRLFLNDNSLTDSIPHELGTLGELIELLVHLLCF